MKQKQEIETIPETHQHPQKGVLPPKPKITSGDCETCGQWDSELVRGMCQWCRDQYGLGSEK